MSPKQSPSPRLALLAAGAALAALPPVQSRSAEPLKLLYVSKKTGNTELYLANADGSEPKNLTNNPAEDGDGAWSADGKKIAFVSNRNGNDDLYAMNADGSEVKRLTSDPVRETGPTWSPDGKRIAYCQVPGELDTVEIYVMDADGGNQENLTKNAVFDADASWSPDGKQILFTSMRGGQGFQVAVMDADGGNSRLVPAKKDTNQGYVFPSWFPDGKQILFADSAEGALELFSSDLAGENRKQITKMKGFNMFPSCSPDGKQIAFYHWDDQAKPGSLWVVDSEGNAQAQLAEEVGPFFMGRPAWKPG